LSYVLPARVLALRDFDKAIQLNPEDGDAYNGRGYARAQLGQYREAVQDAEEALRREPGVSEITYNAACIYAQAVAQVQAGDKEDERDSLTKQYQERAVELVRAALDLLPEGQRGLFWRNAVLPDSALDPVRASAAFLQLKEKYAGPTP
jgi:tetratricopeptide (TPR) repeat protein